MKKIQHNTVYEKPPELVVPWLLSNEQRPIRRSEKFLVNGSFLWLNEKQKFIDVYVTAHI